MTIKYRLAAGVLLTVLAAPGVAMAQQASAVVDLNMRAGPGPHYPIVSVIGANAGVTIHGCTDTGSWCDVTAGQDRGWAYAQYLAYDTGGNRMPVAEATVRTQFPTVEYQTSTYWDEHYRSRPFYAERQRYEAPSGTAFGVASGAITGAVIAGPVGAVVGGVAGAAIGTAIDPPERVDTYVTSAAADPVVLEGEVVIGARLPDAVVLHPVPDYDYHYAYINGQRVLVDPGTRSVVYIYR